MRNGERVVRNRDGVQEREGRCEETGGMSFEDGGGGGFGGEGGKGK